MGQRLVFVGFILCYLYVNHSVANNSGSLLMVHILYRHGDRSSVKSYPQNQYNQSNWPQGFGQLSQKGMQQHYHLGQYFRKRYIEEKKLLSDIYRRNEIHVQSSDYDRTLMSAYSNLAGWYPPGNSTQEWNKNIPWQPIPVHTIPLNEDYFLGLDAPCPRYDQLYQLQLKSDLVKKEEAENKDFYRFITNVTGVSNESIARIWEIYDTLFCEMNHEEDLGFKLPAWVNKTFSNLTVFDKLSLLDSLQFTLMFDGPLRSRLKGGPILKTIVEQMKGKVNGSISPNEQKAFVYSAHDSTVAALTSAMGVFNKKMPPYATTVMIELYNETGKFSVQVWYKNGSKSEDIHPMVIPGCNNPCPFDKFLTLMMPSLPDDIRKECAIGTATISNRLTIIVATTCGTLLLLVMVVVSVLVCKRRQQAVEYRYSGIQTSA